MKYIKTFESLFGEGDYLYHTPHITSFGIILISDHLRAQCSYENACTRDFNAVSLTRDPKLNYDEQPLQFKLNRKKLEEKYKLQSYIDPIFKGRDLEKEEVVTEDINPLSYFIESIQLTGDVNIIYYTDNNDVENIIPGLDKYLKQYPHIKLERLDKMGEVTETLNSASDLMTYFAYAN